MGVVDRVIRKFHAVLGPIHRRPSRPNAYVDSHVFAARFPAGPLSRWAIRPISLVIAVLAAAADNRRPDRHQHQRQD